ncbi:MAG: hypothetical protein ACI8SE_000089 [Bacteroidia bacterium]|jgi:hypothetical protein
MKEQPTLRLIYVPFRIESILIQFETQKMNHLRPKEQHIDLNNTNTLSLPSRLAIVPLLPFHQPLAQPST